MCCFIDCECLEQSRLNNVFSTGVIGKGIHISIKMNRDRLKFVIDVKAHQREDSMIEQVEEYRPWSEFIKKLEYVASKDYSPPSSDADTNTMTATSP